MKYIIAFLILFTISTPVFAMKQVIGDVPVVEPLQPPAVGVSRNLNNIQYNDNTRQTQGVQQSKPVVEDAPILQELKATKSAKSPWVLISTILLGLIVIILIWRNIQKL